MSECNCPGVTKLSEEKVLEMRRLYKAGGISQNALAKKYGVQRITIFRALSGFTWGHLPNATVTRAGTRCGMGIEKAEKIRTSYATGDFTHMQLAVKHRVSLNTISNIINGKTWR